MTRTVGVLTYPLGEDFGLGAYAPHTLRRIYRRALLEKANPRPPSYMRELFAERYPSGTIEDDFPRVGADRIVLLYPDAIGQGWGRIERRLPPGVPVTVLNGRRRMFPLDRRTRRALVVRRALERTMPVEMAALALLAAASLPLVLLDALRGRR